MIDTFPKAWQFTMKWEGGGKTHTVPGDPGGTTKWGIAQAYHPNVDVANLTEAEAQQIARREYWDKCRCDELPYPLDILVWDAAFNMGVARAGKFLQLSLNAFSPDVNLKVDGAIGPKTLEEANEWDTGYVSLYFMLHRLRFYNKRISASPTSLKFIAGWMNRVYDLLSYIGIGDFNETY